MNPYQEFIPLFKALADETRLKIIDMLSCGQMCACEILEQVNISQSTLSYHMKILTDCGVVSATKSGSWMHYSIVADKADQVLTFLRNVTQEKAHCICHEQTENRKMTCE